MYVIPRDTNTDDTSLAPCPTDFPSCDPSASPGPAIMTDQETSDPNPAVDPSDALAANGLAHFGRRNMVGLIVFGVMILLGFILWLSFGKWPKRKFEGATCCRRKRRHARLPDPPKKGIMSTTPLPRFGFDGSSSGEMREKVDEHGYDASSPVLQPLSKIKVKFASTEALIERPDTQ